VARGHLPLTRSFLEDRRPFLVQCQTRTIRSFVAYFLCGTNRAPWHLRKTRDAPPPPPPATVAISFVRSDHPESYRSFRAYVTEKLRSAGFRAPYPCFPTQVPPGDGFPVLTKGVPRLNSLPLRWPACERIQGATVGHRSTDGRRVASESWELPEAQTELAKNEGNGAPVSASMTGVAEARDNAISGPGTPTA